MRQCSLHSTTMAQPGLGWGAFLIWVQYCLPPHQVVCNETLRPPGSYGGLYPLPLNVVDLCNCLSIMEVTTKW